jgi:hypothetical protein
VARWQQGFAEIKLQIASAVVASMPAVAPSQVPSQPFWEASMIAATIVLSPSSASKNAEPT